MNFVKAKSCSLALMLSLLGAIFSHPSFADDTEIFFTESVTSVNPNVLFVVDVSGSMDEEVTGSGGLNRMTVMQNALKTVLKTAPDNLNVGLMNYGEIEDHDEAHGIKFPITDITALAEPVVSEKLVTATGFKEWYYSSTPEPAATTTVRDYLSQITDWYWKDDWYKVVKDGRSVDEMDHVGVTPIVDALYEAAMYFRGEKVSFGLDEPYHNQRTSAHPSTYEGDRILWDEAKCEETYTKTHSDPVDFNKGDYPWYRCPANVGNPQSPGTYANCRNTENCTTETEEDCKDWVDSYCSVSKLVDESGESYCPDGKKVSGYCKNNELCS